MRLSTFTNQIQSFHRGGVATDSNAEIKMHNTYYSDSGAYVLAIEVRLLTPLLAAFSSIPAKHIRSAANA